MSYQEISDILFVLFYTSFITNIYCIIGLHIRRTIISLFLHSFYNKYILYNWPPYSQTNYISIFTLFFNFITNKYTVCLLVYNKHWTQFAIYFKTNKIHTLYSTDNWPAYSHSNWIPCYLYILHSFETL